MSQLMLFDMMLIGIYIALFYFYVNSIDLIEMIIVVLTLLVFLWGTLYRVVSFFVLLSKIGALYVSS